MIKVIIADDQAMIRDGIKFILEKDNEVEVLAVANNGKEAYELCKKLSPEVVLMDIIMPECDGIEGTRLIKSLNDKIKILILTTFGDEENIKKAFQNGADGYVLKDIGYSELISTVKNTAKGLKIIHEDVLGLLVKKIGEYDSDAARVHTELTDREKEILRLIVYGKSNRQIALSTGISEGTVKNIITKILQKFDMQDRTTLAVFAVKNNLV